MNKSALVLCLVVASFVSDASEELGMPIQLAPVPAPRIEVYGNGYPIRNGDAYPNDYDLTDFEYVSTGDREDHSFSIHNSGDADLVLTGPLYVNIASSGHHDFEVRYQPSQRLAPGEWTSFTIRFEPESLGETYVTVTIYSNDDVNSPYFFNVRGGADDDNDDFRWIAQGGCGTSPSVGIGDVFWIPLIILLAVALRRRTSVCVSDRR